MSTIETTNIAKIPYISHTFSTSHMHRKRGSRLGNVCEKAFVKLVTDTLII